MARWIDDKRKRDEEEAQRQQAEREAARAQKAQERQAEAEAQESLRPASEQKVKTAPLVVNLDKQTSQSAARVASRMPDEMERDGFLNEYIAHVKKKTSPNYQLSAPTISKMRELTDTKAAGGVYADTRAKNEKQRLKEIETRKAGKAALQELAGLNLTGFDGQSIDVNTADPATVVRGINSIADDDARAKAAKAFKTLAATEGSRFYGESTDGVGDFLESANLTADTYKEKTKGYADLFYGDGKHDEEDANAYLEARQAIETSEDYSDYAKGQLVAALDKAYNRITGGETPSVSSADNLRRSTSSESATGGDDAGTSLKEGGNERSDESEQKDEKKPGFVAGLTGQTQQVQETAQQEQTEAQGPVQQESAESGGSPEVQGPVQMRRMTPEEKIVASGGMSFDAWMDAGQPSGKVEAQTIGEAAGALLSGRYGEIEGAGKDELDRMLADSAYARRMIGTLTGEDSREIALNNLPAESITYNNIASQGQTIRTLYDAMNSDSFPAELRGDVMAQMVAWASQAEKMEQQGTLGGDAELPLMERLLTTDEHAMDELQSIYEARDELLADKADMRRQQEEQSAQALSDARAAALKGTASEEQLSLVRENADVSDAAVYNDNGYWMRQTDIGAYFAPGADGKSTFETSSVKLNLDAQGVIDTSDY